jgi:hypothetical protein
MKTFASLPTRVRRRVAATLALTALLLPVAAAAGCGEEKSPPPAGASKGQDPSPSSGMGDWVTEIPDDLRIDAGMPRPEGDFRPGKESVLAAVELCEPGSLVAGDPVDELVVAVSGPEYGEFRALRVHDDADAAESAYRTVLARARDCPSRDLPGGTTWLHVVHPGDLGGDRSATVVRTYEQDGMVVLGAEIWQLALVGNALLVTGLGGEYLPGSTLGLGLRENARDLRPVVADLTATFAP